MELSTIAIVIGLAIILVGLLLLRFIIKTAFTLAKVAFVVLVGIGVWAVLQFTGLVGN